MVEVTSGLLYGELLAMVLTWVVLKFGLLKPIVDSVLIQLKTEASPVQKAWATGIYIHLIVVPFGVVKSLDSPNSTIEETIKYSTFYGAYGAVATIVFTLAILVWAKSKKRN